MCEIEKNDLDLNSKSINERETKAIKEEKNIEESDKKEGNTTGLNEYLKDDEEGEETLLSKNEFINPDYPTKKNFCETRYFKRIVLIIFYIISFSFSSIFIRINSLDLIPIKASFIQGAIFSIFIPISFFVSSNKYFKKKRKHLGKEKEVLNTDIEKNMKENLSDYMNKRYYEVYYQYLSKFYLLTAFFSVLYFISIFLFYQGISYSQPLFGQLFFSFVSIILVFAKLIEKGMKFDMLNIISLICILGASALFILSFLNKEHYTIDRNHIYSIIFLGFFAVCQSIIIYFMKNVFKKYFYYVDILEFVGYMGLYILVIVPLILFILYCIYYRELIYDNPSGNSLFYVIGKAFVSTCICDLCLVYILKYFSLKITCKLMIINLSIIYLVFYLVTGKDKILGDYYFLGGQGISVILLVLLMINVYKKNLKREIFEMDKIKLRASVLY